VIKTRDADNLSKIATYFQASTVSPWFGVNRDSGAKSGKPTQGAPKSFWFAESVTLMTAEREGGKSISMGKKSQNFRALAGGKYERTRSSRREADENS
jgi:hypothetical protein